MSVLDQIFGYTSRKESLTLSQSITEKSMHEFFFFILEDSLICGKLCVC